MKKSNSTALTVQEFQGEKVFAFQDLQFDTFNASLVMGSAEGRIPLKIYRSWGLRCIIQAVSSGDRVGQEYFSGPRWFGLRFGCSPKDFEIGDRIRIEVPAIEIRERVISRLRELQEGIAPWEGRFRRLLNSYGRKENKLFKAHNEQITDEFTLAQTVLNKRHKEAHSRLYQEFLAANPIPSVIHLNMSVSLRA